MGAVQQSPPALQRSAISEKHLAAKIAAYAVLSRCIVLGWAVLSTQMVAKYDSSVRLLANTDASIPAALGANWDATYFLGIASEGYTFEQAHAFFPLLPWSAKTLASAASGTGEPTVMAIAIAGTVISNCAFVLAAVILFFLGCRVLGEQHVAGQAALLFCFNPASVFMSAFYTESLFACLSFAGMLILVSPPGSPAPTMMKLLNSALLFALATATRSNGILLGGYLGFSLLLPFLEGGSVRRLGPLLIAGLKLIPALILCISPMLAYLMFASSRYCGGAAVQGQGLAIGSSFVPRPWCESRFPNVYSFVQDHYWNVGLFRYMQVKQIPNFFLASPMALLCFRSAWGYVGKSSSYSRNIRVLPYVLHMIALALLGCFVMHVQVLTRFVAACPVLYWHLASCANAVDLTYFAAYCLLGAAMFSCYYPWS